MYFKSKVNTCFFIAEIGSNHEGSFNKAKELMIQACKSKADLIKLQFYSANGIVNKKYDPQRFEHFKKLSLKESQYIELAKLCKKHKKKFSASIWNREMISTFDKYIDVYKIGSGDLKNFEIIKKIVTTSKPIIISTGLANLNEINDTLSFIKKINKSYFSKKKIALLHCNTAYPTPYYDVNLENIKIIHEKFKIQTGYSDHTIGDEVIKVAYLNGAKIIEKHFSNNINAKSFRDHQISLNRTQVDNFLNSIKQIDLLFKKKKFQLTFSEKKQNNLFSFRRSIYANKNIAKGDIFSMDNLICLRPYIKKGISSDKFFKILGKKAKRNYNKLDLI